MVPAYRSLVEIHKASDDIIELIRKTGQIKRSTMSVQENIQAEKSKKMDDKVNQLKSDLQIMKEENEQLTK